MDGHSSSLLGPSTSTPNILFIVIRPQGRDHPPCWLCILFYGTESSAPCFRWLIIYFTWLYLVTFIISLGAEIIHPKRYIYHLSDHKAVIIHLAGCVSYSMERKSSAPCIRWLIIHFAWLYLVTFIISLGAEIIHPKQFIYNLSDHKAVIIHLAGCVSYPMGPKSSAPCIRWLIIYFTWLYLVTFIIRLGAEIIHPKRFIYHLSDHKAVIIHLAGCVSYSMERKSSAPCICWLIIHFAWLYLVTFIISLGAEIIHPQQFIYNLSDHKAVIIHLASYTLIIRSWTDTHPLSWGRDHPPQTFCLSLSDHKAVIIHLAGCVSYSMGPKSSAPCIRWLIIYFT